MIIKTQIKNKTTKKDTPWTNLGVKVDLKRYLTRRTLVEKYSPEQAKKMEMKEFLISKLHNCELFIHDEYNNYIFFIKKIRNENIILFEKNEKNKIIYIKHSAIWSIFESKYGLNYTEIQQLTQSLLEDLLKLEGYKTSPQRYENIFKP